MFLEVGHNCLVVHHVLGDYSGPVPGVTVLEVLLGHAFQLFLQPDEVGCRRQYYWGAAGPISLELQLLPLLSWT
jgi:hypothetical protein